MANDGSSGGRPQPWHEPRSDEPYGPDQVPGSVRSNGSGQQSGGYTQGGQTYQDDAAVAAYGGHPVPPPDRRRGGTPMIAVLMAALVLIIGGGTAFYLFGSDDEPSPAVVAAPTQDPPAPTTDPDGAEPGTASPIVSSSVDPRFVQQGQCVRNDAPADAEPKLLISDCVPSAYEVLQRFDGKTSGEKDAEAKCARVAGYTNWYFYDSELDSLDFVLCLKRRD